jgi:hypothetical protein
LFEAGSEAADLALAFVITSDLDLGPALCGWQVEHLMGMEFGMDSV